MTAKAKIAIVGAGLSGLSCAYYLEQLGYSPLIYELNAYPGGRVVTYHEDGDLFDRGFQILLSSYEEVNKILDWNRLQVGAFFPGAKVWYRGQWHLIENPLRHPLKFFKTSKLPFLQFSDLWTILKLYLSRAFRTKPINWQQPVVSTADFLKQKGLSKPFLNYFMKPFFGGVFLKKDLDVNVEVFLQTLRFFAEGVACLPRSGMQAIPQAIVKKLKRTQIHYKRKVSAVEGARLFFSSGQEVKADKIVLAVDLPHAQDLLTRLTPQTSIGVTSLYFSIDAHLLDAQPILHLNGSPEGPINNLAFVNTVQPSYAPANRHLVSISVIDPEWRGRSDLQQAAVAQLENWFRLPAARWKFLRSYEILHALPDQKNPPILHGSFQDPRQPDVYLTGELVDLPSINGAIASGRLIAERLDADLKRK